MPENEPIKKSIILNSEEARTKEILILQRTYILDENNFNKLIANSHGFKEWAMRILFISIGWLIKIIGVLIAFLIAYNYSLNTNEKVDLKIERTEVLSIIVAFIVCLILYGIGCLVKTERDKLIESIKSHFKNKVQ